MNAIIIKVNDKVIGVSKIVEIPQKDFIELQKEVVKTWQDKDKQVLDFGKAVEKLTDIVEEHEAKINYLGKQIAIDRGEIDADSEEEYEVVVIKKEPDLAPFEEEIKPEVSEEEDAYFEEKEESEVNE